MNKDITRLIPKQNTVSRGGSTFVQTFYVAPEEALKSAEKDYYPDASTHKKIQAGDRNALGEYCFHLLWRRDGGASKFGRYAASGYTQNIEDVMQEATIVLMNNQDRGKLASISREQMPKYIGGIVHNVARGMARKNHDMNVMPEGVEEKIADHDSLTEQKENQSNLAKISNEIMGTIENPVHRNIFAYFLSGMKHAEIGKKLEISENTSKQVIKRLNDKIRNAMEANGYEGGRDAAKVFRDQYRQSIGEYKVAARPLHDRMSFQGLPISIENQTGSIRTGIDENGKPWATIMDFPYGYIRQTEGADGEHIDCYVGPNQNAQDVFVIHQKNPLTGEYDEDKVMLGFDDAGEASEAYFDHFDDPEFFDSMSYWPIEVFKNKVFSANGKKLTKGCLFSKARVSIESATHYAEMLAKSEPIESRMAAVKSVGVEVSEICGQDGRILSVDTSLLRLAKAERVGSNVEYCEGVSGVWILDEGMHGAAYRLQNGNIVLRKAKAEIGTIRPWKGPDGRTVQMQKVGEGKWEPVKQGKSDGGDGEEKGGKKPKRPKKTDKPKTAKEKKTAAVSDKIKSAFKDAFKSFAETLGAHYSGQATGGVVAGAVEKQGENIQQAGEIAKEHGKEKPQPEGKGKKPAVHRVRVKQKPKADAGGGTPNAAPKAEHKIEKQVGPSAPDKKPDDEE